MREGLKPQKAEIKQTEKEIAKLEAKKATDEAKAAEAAKKVEAEAMLKKLLASGMTAVHISVQERRLHGVLATLSRSKAKQPYIQEPKFHLHEQIGPPCRNV